MPTSSCPARRSTRASTTGSNAGGLLAGWQGAGSASLLPLFTHPPVLGSTTACSCGSPRTCFPPPPLLLSLLASQAPQASGMTTSRCASQLLSWVGGAPGRVPGPRSPQSWAGLGQPSQICFPHGSLISPQTQIRTMRMPASSQWGRQVPPRLPPPSPQALTPRVPSLHW